MKILQLSTGHLGGAGLAARRLNDSLVKAGIDSTFVALLSPSYLPGEHEIAIKRNWIKRTWGGWLARSQRFLSKQTLFTPFSANSIPLNYLLNFASPSETIIHIHNFQNLVSEKSIKAYSEAGYRIVLTLHDQRYFTGGCHYSFNCEQYESGCTKCPLIGSVASVIPRRKLLRSPIEKIHQNKLEIIAPSKWIISRADQSQILGKFRKHHIHNLLGPNWSSSLVNLSQSQNTSMRVGIASMDPTSFIKGGDILDQIINSPLTSNLHFVYLANYSREGRPEEFWGQIDCLLVPSRADNSPNVIHEAKSLGVPVLASDVGGIPELLEESDVCVPLEEMNAQTLISALGEFRNQKKKIGDSTNNFGATNEKEADMLNKYLSVYREMLSRRI